MLDASFSKVFSNVFLQLMWHLSKYCSYIFLKADIMEQCTVVYLLNCILQWIQKIDDISNWERSHNPDIILKKDWKWYLNKCFFIYFNLTSQYFKWMELLIILLSLRMEMRASKKCRPWVWLQDWTQVLSDWSRVCYHMRHSTSTFNFRSLLQK